MAVILNIETSSTVCSVALTADGMIINHYEDFAGRNHAARLSGFINEALENGKRAGLQPDAVAVSMGPGSYTGLRIGLSEAKGLAFALGIPMIGIDTLQLMAVHVMFSPQANPHALFAPMVDARRMEVYTSVYDWSLNPLMSPRPMILDNPNEIRPVTDLLANENIMFFGSGADKAKNIFITPNAIFFPDVEPLAVDMLALSERAFLNGEFLDTAYCTPNYLKDFQATKPKPLLGGALG